VDPPVIRDVLGTRTGLWLGVRVLAWIAFGAALLAPVPWLAALPGALLVAGPALAGHAAAQAPVALLAPLDVLHVAGAALWVGGLVALLVAMPAATRRLEAPARTTLLAGALARFSPIALLSVLALAATGAVQAAIHLEWTLAPLAGTAFGRALLVKSGLLAVLLGAAVLQRRRILPALRALAAGGEAPGGAGVLLRRALRAEVALLLGVLAATAVLAGSPPPRAAAAQAAGPFSADVAIGPQRLQMTVDPARPGTNEVHVYLLDARTGAPFTGSEELRVDAALPAKGIGPLRLRASPAGPGHWVVTGAQLAPAGRWRITVTNRVSEFDEHAAKVPVTVR
jgi:copper transport protein